MDATGYPPPPRRYQGAIVCRGKVEQLRANFSCCQTAYPT